MTFGTQKIKFWVPHRGEGALAVKLLTPTVHLTLCDKCDNKVICLHV